jgi:hypothetical protein
VENTGGGTADLELVAKMGSTKIKSKKVHFFQFTSMIIGLSGESGVFSGDWLTNGMRNVAERLRDRGYNSHYFDEDNVNNNTGDGPVYDMIVRAIQHCGIQKVAIYGHSHGGGSTHDLAEGLDNNRQNIGTFVIEYTAYVDAIESDNIYDADPEIRFPPGSQSHFNYFQNNSWPVGESVPGANPNLNVNTTDWGANLNHGSIDNHDTVIDDVTNFIQQVGY